MSDDEFQREVIELDSSVARSAEDEEEEDSKEESRTRFPLYKKRKGKRLSELRHPRQKFCARWEAEFPWLKADRVDQSLGYCTICSKHLVCKKSHLERHQDSYRHIRMQMQNSGNESGDVGEVVSTAVSIATTDGEDYAQTDNDNTETEYLECTKRETEEEDDYIQYDAESDQDIDETYAVEFEAIKPSKVDESDSQQQVEILEGTSETSVTMQPILMSSKPKVGSTVGSMGKIDRLTLLRKIDHDRHQLSEYLFERRKQSLPSPPTYTTSANVHYHQTSSAPLVIPVHRDPSDLFFDSVSATVKTLPPKLAAEVKSRVSQIIAEFELRAICEREAQESAAAAGSAAIEHTVVVTTNSKSNETTPAVPNIVYSFQS